MPLSSEPFINRWFTPVLNNAARPLLNYALLLTGGTDEPLVGYLGPETGTPAGTLEPRNVRGYNVVQLTGNTSTNMCVIAFGPNGRSYIPLRQQITANFQSGPNNPVVYSWVQANQYYEVED